MANSLSAFVPEVWAREGIEILREKLVMAALVHRDFSNEVANFGDTVNTRKPGKFSANTKGATSDVTIQDVTATNVQVVLNQHKEVSFMIYDIEASKSFQALVDIYLDPAMLAIANAIDTALFGLYTDITTNITILSTDTWYDTAVNAKVQLNTQLAPRDERRHMVVSDTDEGAILKTDELVRWDATGVGGEDSSPILTGKIGKLAGFMLYSGTNVPSVGSPAVRKNLAFHKNAFALVSRPLATAVDETPGAMQFVANDPDTGIALRVTMSYNATKLATQVTVDVLYGVKTLDANLAVRIDV